MNGDDPVVTDYEVRNTGSQRMITEELKRYIRESSASGKTPDEIRRDLLVSGWQNADITEALKESGTPHTSPAAQPSSPATGTTMRRIVYAIFIVAIIALCGVIFYLWQSRLDLGNTNAQKVRDFYTRLAQSQISFTDAGNMVFPDEQRFLTQKNEYVQNKVSFIEADLSTMQLTLYENGASSTTMKILTKGKEGSWWEMPTGNYKTLGKAVNAFSSIGNVWMPYSIQFYGNYLIHGWPYHEDGTPVPQGYSGGCIRLSTEDAKTVFNFAKVGTPILVLENDEQHSFGTLTPMATDAVLPNVGAKSFLISDLSSGEKILEKRAEDKLPIASLTKLMTGVVAHEVIYLGKSITVSPQMLASVSATFYPAAGSHYIGLDLLYPLLMQSSNDTADVLAGFIGTNTFVGDMNAKALSLQMKDTQFADASGISAENISTAVDFSKLLQYIYYKRRFLFDITKGVAFDNVGIINIGNTVNIKNLKNFNEFAGDPDLIGMKNGETTAARQTMATVWNLHTAKGDVPVAIVVLGSEDRKADTDVLLKWLKENYAAPNG